MKFIINYSFLVLLLEKNADKLIFNAAPCYINVTPPYTNPEFPIKKGSKRKRLSIYKATWLHWRPRVFI